MNRLKSKILALLTAAVLAFSLAAPSTVSAASATERTTCAGTESLGLRVCIDKNTAYGPTIYVYGNPYNYSTYTARAEINDAGGILAFDATSGISVNSSYVYITGIPSPSQCSYTYLYLNGYSDYCSFGLRNNANMVINGQSAPYSAEQVWSQIQTLIGTWNAKFLVVN